MAEEPPTSPSPIDPSQFLKIVIYQDHSLSRHTEVPNILAKDNDPQTVICFDLPLLPFNKTWVRVFQPPEPNQKLPLVIYFHGGSFILHNPASKPYNDFCVKLATNLNVTVLSFARHLAPEQKLPTAYEDAVKALLWVKTQSRELQYKFSQFIDFTKCFIMGSSAGANVAYHAALRAMELDLEPVKLRGVVLSQPFFGGVERKESELRLVDDERLPLVVADFLWELSLPEGADRDHEFCNPLAGRCEGIGGLPRCLVRGYDGDPLVDRHKEFAKMLEENGVSVVKHFGEGGFHDCELELDDYAQDFVKDVKEFICSC